MMARLTNWLAIFTGGIITWTVLFLEFRIVVAQTMPDYCPTSTDETPVRPNPARVFPICIGKDPEISQWDDEIVKLGFDKVFDNIDKNRNLGQDTVRPKWNGFRYSPHVDQIQPSITAADIIPYYLAHVYKPKADVLMDNWVHLELLGLNNYKGQTKPIVGLYVQAIQGPLGIPFGEFVNIKFTPGNNRYPGGPANQKSLPNDYYNKFLSIYPCTFYAKAGLKIPQVLMWSAKEGNYQHEGRFAVTFKWDENACAEVAFFQFIIIVVYDFQNLIYHVALSNVMLPGRLNFSTSGLAYPYYPDWGPNEILLKTDNEIENDFIIKSKNDPKYLNYRILSHLEYEHCFQHHVGLVKKGAQKGTCPPGPFQCLQRTLRTRPADLNKLRKYKEDLWKKWSLIYLQYNPGRSSCNENEITTSTTTIRSTTTKSGTSTTTIPSSTSVTTSVIMSTSATPITTSSSIESTESATDQFLPTPGTVITTTWKPTEVDNQTREVSHVAKKVEKKKIINHGDTCVFIWFVLIPVSNYIARFFKDFENWNTLGIGFWIAAHVIMHHTGILLMWISLGLVVSNGISFFGGAPAGHYVFGFPAAVLQHYELFKGFTRDTNLQVANRQSIIHAINGYLSGILSLCCAEACRMDERKSYIIYILYGVTLVSILCGNLIERKVEKRLGMYPPRKVFPVLERVMMVNTKPRHYKLKIFVTVVYILIILSFYYLYWIFETQSFQSLLHKNKTSKT